MFGGYRTEAPHADRIGRIAERLASRVPRNATPRRFGQCRHERPPGQPTSGLSQILPIYVRTTGETDDICIRFSPPLLRRTEIMPEAGLRTLRRTAECSGRGHRAGRTRRSPLFKRIGRVSCVGFHSYQVARNRKTMKKYPKYCIFENLSLYLRCSYMYEQIYMIQT